MEAQYVETKRLEAQTLLIWKGETYRIWNLPTEVLQLIATLPQLRSLATTVRTQVICPWCSKSMEHEKCLWQMAEEALGDIEG